ncbi:hypothetical protein [Microbacterium sp. ZW T5_56]|uniref:hypothetical protein n=1 Tax=Microbacterium sp. ZW T5_56 TaxID=3378081 RepID=UPI00385270B5
MALFNRRRRDDDEQASSGALAEVATDDSLSMIEALFASPVAPSALPSTLAVLAEPARRAAAHVALESGIGVPVLADELPTRAELDQIADPVPLESDPAPPDNRGRESSPSRIGTEEERARMANLEQSVQDLLSIDGATGAAIADSASGMALAEGGHPGFDLGIAAAGNSNVVRAKLQTVRDLGLSATIDDILITLDQQYHLINVLHSAGNEGLFVYLVLDRSRANLALARHKLTQVAGQIQI